MNVMLNSLRARRDAQREELRRHVERDEWSQVAMVNERLDFTTAEIRYITQRQTAATVGTNVVVWSKKKPPPDIWSMSNPVIIASVKADL